MPAFWVFLTAEISALLCGSLFFKIIRQKFLFLYLFVLVGVSTEIFNHVLIKLGTQNNLWVSHIYFPLEFLFIALFYLHHLTPFIRKHWIILTIALFMLFAIVNTTFIQGLKEYSQTRVYSSLILVVFSLIYFYKVLDEAKIRNLTREPLIWANAAVLLFFSTIFFYNLLRNIIFDLSRELIMNIQIFNAYMIAFFYVIIAITFGLEGRQQIKEKRVRLK